MKAAAVPESLKREKWKAAIRPRLSLTAHFAAVLEAVGSSFAVSETLSDANGT